MRVEGLYDNDNGYLTEFSLTKRQNEHSLCNFSINIKEGEKELIDKVGGEISVWLDNTEIPIPVFFGRIKEVFVSSDISGKSADIVAVSNSFTHDEKPFTRIFQNPRKKLKDIANAKKLNLNNCSLNLSDKFANTSYEGVIIQNNETDFAFLKRLAASLSEKLWVTDDNNGGGFLIDIAREKLVSKIDVKSVISLKTGREKSKRIAKLVSDKYYRFGHVYDIENIRYVINEWQLKLEDNADSFYYELEEFKENNEEFNLIPVTVGEFAPRQKFSGKIISISDPLRQGRVIVDFNQKDVQDADKERTWFHWRTPYAGQLGGMVFMPDLGDTVEGIVNEEEEFYICAATRSKPLSTFVENIRDKYILSNTNEGVIFHDNSLEIRSGNNKIVLRKDKIEMWVNKSRIELNSEGIFGVWNNGNFALTNDASFASDGNTRLYSKDALTLKTDNKLNISANKDITTKTEQKIDTEAKQDIAVKSKGKVKVDAIGDLSLNSGGNLSVNAKGQAGLGSGGNLNLNAKGQTEISSGGNIKIKGSKVGIC